jgi:hypothetical protein
LARATHKKLTRSIGSGEKTERVADASEPVVAIPPVVVAVNIHVPLVVPAVEDDQYCTKHHPYHHPLKAKPISRLYFIRYRNTPMLRTKYLYFFEVGTHHAIPNRDRGYSGLYTQLDSVAGNRDRPRIHLVPHSSVSKVLHEKSPAPVGLGLPLNAYRGSGCQKFGAPAFGSQEPRAKAQVPVLRFRGLLADASEPAAAIPPVVAAVNIHAPLVVPAVEDDVGSPVVLTETPLASHGTLVGERRIVFHVLRESKRIGLEIATLVLGVELPGGGVVVELEELQLDVLAFTVGHHIHDRLGRVLLAPSRIECLLRRLVAVDVAHQTGERGAHHLDQLAERCEEHYSEVVGSEGLLYGLGAELVAMLARRVTELVGQIVDLAVGHLLGCGHGLVHGVILSVVLVFARERPSW